MNDYADIITSDFFQPVATDPMDNLILFASFFEWLTSARQYWRINESSGSRIAHMPEAAD